jgi:hypothetical protein
MTDLLKVDPIDRINNVEMWLRLNMMRQMYNETATKDTSLIVTSKEEIQAQLERYKQDSRSGIHIVV